MRFVLVGILLAILPGCAPDLDQIDAEVSRVCVRDLAMPFAGTANGPATSRIDISRLDIDMGDLVGATVTLDSVELAPGAGISDFAFADSIRVDLTARSQDPAYSLVDVGEVGAASPVRGGSDSTDLTPYLEDSSAGLEIVVAGDVPATPWAATLAICLSVES